MSMLTSLHVPLGVTPTLAAGAVLVSFWKPLLLLAPILAWAWLVSAVFDKHAARFHLGREKWNTINLLVGLVAIAVALAIPIKSPFAFLAALGAIIIILGADIVAFVTICNKDERVPERHRLRLDFSSLKEARLAKAEAKREGKAQLHIDGPNGRLDVPEQDSPEFALRVAAETIFIDGLLARASQVDVVPGPKEGAYTISHLVDGVRQSGRQVTAAEAVQIIDLWKRATGLNTDDRRRRLVGNAKVRFGENDHQVRITTSGARGGIRMTMLYDPALAVKRKPGDLGFLDRQMDELKRLVEERRGIVLLATPAHAGRTTLMYSVLKVHDAYTQNVQTVETEPQGEIEGIRQNVFDPLKEDGPAYATFVRSLLRRDPDVLAIADLPDTETAKEAARIEPDRARVYVSLRADNALAAIQTWIKAVGDQELASQALVGVVAGKLVRRLCENCRVPYQPSKEMLTKLGLPADKVQQLFKKGGQVVMRGNKPEICPICAGVGYLGQTGIFEIFPIGDEERAAIRAGDLNALRSELRKKQLPTMQQAALRKAVEGVTSIEEITRITSDKAAKSTPPQPTASPA